MGYGYPTGPSMAPESMPKPTAGKMPSKPAANTQGVAANTGLTISLKIVA